MSHPQQKSNQAEGASANETLELLLRHRSIRKFTADPISKEQIEAIVGAAQMASTSSNVQAYSIIGVIDADLKRGLAALAGNQAYIEQCPLFLVWCADLHRLDAASRKHGVEPAMDFTENLLVSTVDTSLAAQNAAIAAESLGLGIVYIGGIRNHPAAVCELLKLPPLVYPVFGMCVGVPAQDPGSRPRLAPGAVYHENVYRSVEPEDALLEEYDQRLRSYYLERTGGKRDTTWTREMADKYSKPIRAHIRAFLAERGLGLR
ncbi:oxygen-insensitive NADPH nitroreductase [Paenibacillus sp. y28]|uniref:oxygen-insensitive NADPH nitroreductase n=1 Tax=Paenibacillus sp. y28 TaxID=3129110 RepID=UPI003019CA05